MAKNSAILVPTSGWDVVPVVPFDRSGFKVVGSKTHLVVSLLGLRRVDCCASREPFAGESEDLRGATVEDQPAASCGTAAVISLAAR